jgi:uncharacterized protein involved in response to NO
MLLSLGAANGMTHFAALHGDILTIRAASRVALDVIVLMIALMTGRVVPMFTRNATRLNWIRSQPILEGAALGTLLLLTICDIWPGADLPSTAFSGLAAVFLLARMRFWGSLRCGREPLLWILHLGTMWLPIGLLLRVACAMTPFVPASSSLHALTAGAIGSLTLGMMARVSLGHTGRVLQAPRVMAISFLCLVGAAVLRVAAPFLGSSAYFGLLVGAAIGWSSAFALYLLNYWTILLSPRADAR